MITDVVRIVADWLADATHGVAAGLTAVPLDVGVTRAAAPTLYDETRDGEASRLQAPDVLPALVVNTGGGLQQGPIAVRPFPADAEVELVLRHIVRDLDTDEALAWLAQGQRAIQRSMGRLFTAAGSEAARVRNDVQLYSLRSYRADLFRANDDTILTMAHTYTVAVRDVWGHA